MTIKIFPYKLGSKTARDLAELLDVYQLRGPERIRSNRWNIVNWGRSGFTTNNRILNRPEAVAIAQHKTRTFEALRRFGVNIPEFTTDSNTARDWPRGPVVCRSTVTGHSGVGITIVENPLDITQALLYTRYIKKAEEWRVHVFNGKMIDYAKKIKVQGKAITGDQRVRSHLNGYVFAKNNIPEPRQSIITEAIKAVQALGLDFGGVDVIWNEHLQKAFVLEINTAPGLEGSALRAYAEAIKEYWRVH